MDNISCSKCQEPLPDNFPPGQPCPKCGAGERAVNLEARLTLGVTTVSASLIVVPYSETLLAKSQELIDKGDFNIAIVVAHMACEIQAERVLSKEFLDKGLTYLEDAVLDLLSGYNLGNKRILDLFNSMTGKRPQDQPFWQAFKNSSQLRNKIVHHGQAVTRPDAVSSHTAASELIAYIK